MNGKNKSERVRRENTKTFDRGSSFVQLRGDERGERESSYLLLGDQRE